MRQPLNIAACITWLVVCLSVVDADALRRGVPTAWMGLGCMTLFLADYIALVAHGDAGRRGAAVALSLLQGPLVVAAEFNLYGGQTSVLLIVVAAMVAVQLSPRQALLYLVAINLALIGIWLAHGAPLLKTALSMTSVAGFQAFAALTGHYAHSRETAREHLAAVNAELMATRRLLEESARAGERLKLSRELHDVAGHTLTALKLNLARLARDPALAGREELQISAQLADELLGQIRQVVSALRVHDGLDLRAAFDALATPLPGVQVRVDMDPGLRVDDIDRAETLLRCAQEAITNAVRHGRAREVRLSLQRRDGELVLQADNDGRAPVRIEAGNGLTGMRERIASLGGDLTIEPTPPQGLRVVARLPERLPRTLPA